MVESKKNSRINDYLTGIFNNVLVIEEQNLKDSEFSDVSLKEMHTMEAVGLTGEMTGTDIAKKLMITPSTVTISLNNLEKKGYITRQQSQADRRVVYVGLTEKGQKVYQSHRKFHQTMVKNFLKGISDKDVEVLSQGLKNLYDFLEELKA